MYISRIEEYVEPVCMLYFLFKTGGLTMTGVRAMEGRMAATFDLVQSMRVYLAGSSRERGVE